MIISQTLPNIAVKMIYAAQRNANNAGQAIAELPMQNNATVNPASNSSGIIKPLLNLNEAELETSAAVKILTTDKKMVGSLLDVKA